MSSLTVHSGTSATASLDIDAAAATGPRNIALTTNAEVVTLNNGFTVTAGAPALLTVNPNSGQQGQQNLTVAITGKFTHFVQGISQVTFGAGITAGAVIVTGPTALSAQVTIASNAALGPRSVSVTTGTETATMSGGFSVNAAVNQPLTVSVGSNQTFTLGVSEVKFVEYPIPSGESPYFVTAGPDGNLWFTEAGGTSIGRISTSGLITLFTIPNIPTHGGRGEGGITAGPDGNLWFADYFSDSIGRITPAGVITEFPIPPGNSYPFGIASGADGNLWFTETVTNKIGRITPAGVITEFSIPSSGSYYGGSGPSGITAGADGNLWFTETYGNRIGKITTAGVITEFTIPTDGSYVTGITAGPDGNLWFTESLAHKIGKITPAGVITEFAVSPTSQPYFVTAGPDGNLWFTTDYGGNQIGRITPGGVTALFPTPNASNRIWGIAAGPDGNLWFAEGSANKIASANYGVFADAVTGTLNGGVTDDGLPVGAMLSTAWRQTVGPGPVSFGTPTAAFPNVAAQFNPVNTTATFNAQGTYEIALTGTDSLLSDTASVGVMVNPPQAPSILSLTPNAGQQGQQGLSMAITGQFTHFAQGTTQISFGAGITVLSLTVTSETTATVVANIDPLATLGPRRITVSTGIESATLGNALTIQPGTPILVSANPNTGQQGQQNLSVTITGQYTHFVQTATSANFGTGITVGTVAVTSAMTLAVQITIAANATLGSRTVTVTTGSEVVSLSAGFVVVPAGNQAPVVTAGPDQTVTLPPSQLQFIEYPGPTTPTPIQSGVRAIVTGPDGNLWFTFGYAYGATEPIGRITPGGVMTTFPIPSGSSEGGITVGSDGNLWFTAYRVAKIGRITPAGVITEFPTPTSGSYPYWITSGPDGNLWFTESNVNKIGRITPSGAITEFPVPSGSQELGARHITAGPDGNLWFTICRCTVGNSNNGSIGRITPAGLITEFPTSPGSAPDGITSGPDGNLWFTEVGVNKIARITPAGVNTEFPVPTPDAGPEKIIAGPDGNLWFTEALANKIGRMTPAGVITEYLVATPDSRPHALAVGPDCNLWFTEQAATVNQIAKVTPWGIAPLNGSISDDGLPLGSTLTANWSATNGPGYVGFCPSGSATFPDVSGQTYPMPTSAVFSVPGTYTVRLMGSDTALSSTSATTITVNQSQGPSLLSVTPSSGQPGHANLSVATTGQATHFAQGSTMASFGVGIVVLSVTVTDGTHLNAVITIDSAAALGARTVVVTTGSEIASLPNGFSVQASGPTILTVNPNSGQQGQSNLAVAVTGQNTHFAQGTTQVSFGTGITVNSVAVASSTSLMANVAVLPTAVAGLRTVTATTGTESASLTGGFLVTAGTPALLTVNPNTGRQGEVNLSVAVVGQFTNWVQGTSVVSFGAGITVDSVTVASPTSLTAKISIAPNRVAKTVAGVTTRYLVDDRNLTGFPQVVEEVANGVAQRVYTYGLNRISQSQASGTSFYGYDGHGNVRILTDSTGAVTDRYDYDAFGNLLSQAGTTPNVYLYSGEQSDPNLGLYYLRSRYLSIPSGRFWTLDSFEGTPDAPLSLHKYLYSHADPVNRIDPAGTYSLTEAVATVAITNILATASFGVYNAFRSSRRASDAAIPDAVAYGVSVTGTISNGLIGTLPLVLALGTVPAQEITALVRDVFYSTPIGFSGTVGLERVASARSLEVDSFRYTSNLPGVTIGYPFGSGVTITAYQAIIYNLDSLDEYAQANLLSVGVTASIPGAGLAGLTFSAFGNGKIRGYLLGASLSFPPGAPLLVGAAYRGSTALGPRVTGLAAVDPFLRNAFPPNNFLLQLRARGWR